MPLPDSEPDQDSVNSRLSFEYRLGLSARRQGRELVPATAGKHTAIPVLKTLLESVQNMTSPDLKVIACAVVNRIRVRGYILPREIRTELREAGQPTKLWKQVVGLIHPPLEYCGGRYYALPAVISRLKREESQLGIIQEMVQQLVLRKQYDSAAEERRREDRHRFLQTVKVQDEKGGDRTVLLEDLSPSGVRFMSSRNYLGHRLSIALSAQGAANVSVILVMRIVWSCAVADGLYQHGGCFLELVGSCQVPEAT
jgi:hypothetical protein